MHWNSNWAGQAASARCVQAQKDLETLSIVAEKKRQSLDLRMADWPAEVMAEVVCDLAVLA